MESGDDLLSRAVSSQVPSALRALTSVFGMGTGASLSLLSPEILFCFQDLPLESVLRSLSLAWIPSARGSISVPFWVWISLRFFRALKTAQEKLTSKRLAFLFLFLDQALDRLVSASSRIAALSPPTYCLIVFEGSYFFRMGIFFLRLASRLDAFSVYPIRISLPSYAVGTTTVAPGMRPLRSSRTRSSSSHDSFAHDG